MRIVRRLCPRCGESHYFEACPICQGTRRVELNLYSSYPTWAYCSACKETGVKNGDFVCNVPITRQQFKDVNRLVKML